MHAIRHLKPVYWKASRAMHLTPQQTVFHILIPETLPEVVTGIRVGFSVTLLGVLLGEMFASKRGLGSLIVRSVNTGDVKTPMSVALLLFVFAATVNGILLGLEHRLHKRV